MNADTNEEWFSKHFWLENNDDDFQASKRVMSIKRDAFLNLSLSEKGGPQVHSRKTIPESCDSLSGGSEYLATRKLSVVGRSNAVQSPIVPSIALSATTSLDQANNEEPSALQGK